MSKKKKRMILGSGKSYILEYTGEIPEDDVIETDDNLLGHTSGGATLSYTPTYYTAKDDHGLVEKTILTDEEAKLLLGICTLNGTTIAKLVSTARVVEDTDTHRIIEIGGAGNDDGKNYIIRFVHADPVDSDIRITIIGKNEAGLSLAFAKDKETVVNPEFKAKPHGEKGTRIIYKETYKTTTTTTTTTTT